MHVKSVAKNMYTIIKDETRYYPEYEQVADFLAIELELREHQRKLSVFPHHFSVLTPR